MFSFFYQTKSYAQVANTETAAVEYDQTYLLAQWDQGGDVSNEEILSQDGTFLLTSRNMELRLVIKVR
jgi:hypothetical protein